MSLDTCDKIRGFDVSRKGMETETQKGATQDFKLGLWALRNPIDQFWGVFGEIYDFVIHFR